MHIGIDDDLAKDVEVGRDDPTASSAIKLFHDVLDALGFGDSRKWNPEKANKG
jgi:hypothetical protein